MNCLLSYLSILSPHRAGSGGIRAKSALSVIYRERERERIRERILKEREKRMKRKKKKKEKRREGRGSSGKGLETTAEGVAVFVKNMMVLSRKKGTCFPASTSLCFPLLSSQNQRER